MTNNIDASKVFFFCEVGEFHAFQKFNMFLWQLKERNSIPSDKEIVAIYPEAARGIITHCDMHYVISNSFISNKFADAQKYIYPKILEEMNGRNMAGVFSYVEHLLMTDDKQTEIYHYHYDKVVDGFGNESFTEFFSPSLYGNEPSTLGRAETRDFIWLKEWLEKGNVLMPTYHTFQNTNNKYGILFNVPDKKNIILLTRSFKNKQPETNTESLFPKTFDLVDKLCQDDGVNVINIGFPPSKVPELYKHRNYIELDKSFTQEELMSLFYLADCVLLNAENGGYTAHISCKADMFVLSKEYGERVRGTYHCGAKKLGSPRLTTEDLSYLMLDNKIDEAAKIILNHKKTWTNDFASPIKFYKHL